MATPDEIDKAAAAGNAMRPEWPLTELRSHLAANYGTRSYQELASAVAYIAADPMLDPTTLATDGPWWRTSDPAPKPITTKSGQRQTCPEHNIPLTAGTCQRCTERTAEHIPGRAAQLWAAIKNQEN